MKSKRRNTKNTEYCNCHTIALMKYITDDFRLPVTIFIRELNDHKVKDISGFLKIVDCGNNYIVINLFDMGKQRYITFDQIVFITKFDEFEALSEEWNISTLKSAINNHQINTNGLRNILRESGIA